jgi:hypothetical protein
LAADPEAAEQFLSDGYVVCPKITYLSAEDAAEALRRVRKKRSRKSGRGKERAVYRCHRCKKWHLTSQKRETYT